MLNLSPARRAGTSDEIATLAALLMGEDRSFVSASDSLIGSGINASSAGTHGKRSGRSRISVLI